MRVSIPVNGQPPPLELGSGALLAVLARGVGCDMPMLEALGRTCPVPCDCRLCETIAERGAAALGIGIR